MTSKNCQTVLFNTDFWIMAAKWEMEENSSMETARGLLQRGLRFNPLSKKLWLEVSCNVWAIPLKNVRGGPHPPPKFDPAGPSEI